MQSPPENVAEDCSKNKKTVKPRKRDLNGNTKLLTLIFILLLCVKSLEGRPGILGLESGETSGGNPLHTDALGAPSAVTKPEHSKSNIKLAEQDDDLPNIQRYPISQMDFGHVKTPFIIGAWILSASLAKIAFHMTPKLHKYVPESCLLILVGVVVGVIMLFSTNFFVSPLTPNTFFLYMLPPIILDAGYFMPNRKFFDNLGTIILMAVVGTIFNIATIGVSLWLCGLTGIYGLENTPSILDTFVFASLIAAVDPVAVLAVFEEIKVNEVLYIVVFGESLLNDAVTVVMYHMMEAYDEIGVENIIPQDIISGVASFFVVALGGTVIGIAWGFLMGFVTRFTRHVLIIEPIFVFLMAYLSYLNAEMFHMSGILAITFCGITGKNYVESNISPKSQTTIKYALKMLSNSSETIIFMFLGVASVHSSHLWNTWFVILTILFCSVFRTLGVILFSWLANRSRLHKLTPVDQFVMSYGGLRGAVAFALVLLIDERVVKQKDMFVTTTIAVIYFTVFLQGITIKPLVEILNVKRADKRELTMNERINKRFIDHVMAGIEDIIGHNTGNYNLRDKFRRFNDRFIRPLLIRDAESSERKIIQTYSKLTLQDAMAIMQKSASFAGQIPEAASSNSLNRNYFLSLFANSADFRASLEEPYSKYFDVPEFDFGPTRRDLFDNEIHHLRTEQWRPYKNKPKNIESKSSEPSSKGNQRTHKIRFRRYITNKKHRFLKDNAGQGSDSEQTKKNLVSFSDQKPPHLRGDNSEMQTDDDDEGLTLHIRGKGEDKNEVKKSTPAQPPKAEIHVAETHHFQFPWRDLYDRKKRSIDASKSSVVSDTDKPSACDKPKSNVQETLGHATTNLPHIDSATSQLSSSSYKTAVRNQSITSDSPGVDGSNASNGAPKPGIASDENVPQDNELLSVSDDLPQRTEPDDLEMQELDQKRPIFLRTKSHRKEKNDSEPEAEQKLLGDIGR